jgi:uncharacterized protein (TIGR00369 family)
MTPIQLTQEAYDRGEAIPGFAVPPITRFLDGRIESHDPVAGVLRMSFATRSEYANPMGAVNGGIVSAMLDDTMGPLILAQTGGTKVQASVDLHTTFFKPVPIGPRAMVEARIDRIARAVAYTNAVLIDDKGEVLARAVHTAAFLQPPAAKGA